MIDSRSAQDLKGPRACGALGPDLPDESISSFEAARSALAWAAAAAINLKPGRVRLRTRPPRPTCVRHGVHSGAA
jgi:hypothetical protein